MTDTSTIDAIRARLGAARDAAQATAEFLRERIDDVLREVDELRRECGS